ncbi:hypothetical protein FB451DRAFT_1417289 [Mycena latifolia]|nr:hypothetical protein FB451DRAFT_1417289 [Mycena latifolia]
MKMATPPPTYSTHISNVEMDTSLDVLNDTNPTRNNLIRISDTDTSDAETDDSMPDLVPPSPVSAPSAIPNTAANNNDVEPAAVVHAGVTTLIQHIGSLSIASSVTNGVDPGPGRHQPISADHREVDPVPADTSTNLRHAHITKLHGETRAANNAIRAAVLETIEETRRYRTFNNNNRRGYGRRANASTNARLFALLERLHRIEVILRRLERLINLLTAAQL